MEEDTGVEPHRHAVEPEVADIDQGGGQRRHAASFANMHARERGTIER
jgi:hypothetical protein